MNILNDRKHAFAAVYLLPFPIGIVLQILTIKIDFLEQAFLRHWYPFGVVVAILIVSLPSFLLIAKLPAFAGKRRRFVGIFLAALIVLMPLVSLVNVVTVCSIMGGCTMDEGEDLNGN